MTLSELKQMLRNNSDKVWIVRRWSNPVVVIGNVSNTRHEGDVGEPERRRIVAIRSKDVVWSRKDKPNIYMPLPRASEIEEARFHLPWAQQMGCVRFKYAETGVVIEIEATEEE